MSLFSPDLGAAIPATAASGQTPVDEVYSKLTVAAAVFLVMLEVGIFVTAGHELFGQFPRDGMHYVIGRDFLNTWMGGRSLFQGGPASWFDYRVYSAMLQQMLGGPYPDVYWSYPPHVVLFVWPFGLMPYLPAYIAWCIAGVGLYLIACSSIIPRERLLFLAVAPGVALCVFCGQNGFYTSALLIGGLLNLDRRPVLAGVLFGILTVKPQLGLLLPVLLLLERRWVTIAAAATTTAILVAATAALFGWNVWLEFWQKVLPQQLWLTENGEGLLYSLVASAFFGARLVGLPLGVAWAIQYVVAVVAFAAVVWTYWKRRDPALSLALFVTATFLFTPYILNYDMVIFGFVVALLRDRPGNTIRDHWLLLAVWTLPVTMMFSAVCRVPLAPLVLIAFASRLLWQLAHSEDGAVQLLPKEVAAL